MKKQVAISLMLGLFMFPMQSHALYCGNKIISEGDSLADIKAKCGAPLIAETSHTEVTKTYSDGIVRKSDLTIAYLLYDFGPNVFVRILKFRDDKLVEIVTGEYGGSREATPKDCWPPWTGVSVGDTMAIVRYRCGSPNLIETPEEVSEDIGTKDNYRLTLTRQIVEWSYQMERDSLLSVLRFEDGAVTTTYKRDLNQK